MCINHQCPVFCVWTESDFFVDDELLSCAAFRMFLQATFPQHFQRLHCLEDVFMSCSVTLNINCKIVCRRNVRCDVVLHISRLAVQRLKKLDHPVLHAIPESESRFSIK